MTPARATLNRPPGPGPGAEPRGGGGTRLGLGAGVGGRRAARPRGAATMRGATTSGGGGDDGVVRLAIADPPYPRFVGSGGRKNRGSRWYGTGQRSRTDRPADHHRDVAEWDEPARHQQLLGELLDTYDGWAIATTPDGLAAYGTLPVGTRIMSWVKPNAQPGAHRLRSTWEAVILYPPCGRRSNRTPRGSMADTLAANVAPGFRGRKPSAWTHWVLDALSYNPAIDTVDDLFAGSGAVAEAINEYGGVSTVERRNDKEAWPS